MSFGEMTTWGVTGRMGSGKSTLIRAVRGLSRAVMSLNFDDDWYYILRDVTDPASSAASAAVEALYGEAPRAADGAIDYGWLEREYFANPTSAALLHEALRPLAVRRFIQRLEVLDAGTPVLVEGVSLVTGQCLQLVGHRLVHVETPPEVCVTRVAVRDHCTLDRARVRVSRHVSDQSLEAAVESARTHGRLLVIDSSCASAAEGATRVMAWMGL